MKKLWIVLLSLFLLTGCGQKPETPIPPSDPSPTQQEPNDPPASPEPETPARAEQVDLTFFVEGEEEALPATLYVGDGYSLYIPDEDWDGPEQSTESGVPTDTWVSAFNSDVALSVSRYGDMTVTEARDAFAQSSGYEFEDLMGGSPDDPLTGTNEKGEYLSFFVAAGGGADSYAVSWRYPAEAAEGFGTRLPTIAETFRIARKTALCLTRAVFCRENRQCRIWYGHFDNVEKTAPAHKATPHKGNI